MGRIDSASRVIAAPRADVYRALTDAVARAAWLPPDGMTGTVSSFDLREGGGYRMVLTYDDPAGAVGKTSADSDVVEARFVDLVPDELVRESVEFEADDPAFSGTMTMTWTLSEVTGSTRVTIEAADVPAGISAAEHEKGLRSSLTNLAAYLARR